MPRLLNLGVDCTAFRVDVLVLDLHVGIDVLFKKNYYNYYCLTLNETKSGRYNLKQSRCGILSNIINYVEILKNLRHD